MTRAEFDYALQKLIEHVRYEAIGWAWTEACIQLDNNKDPRQSDMADLLQRAKIDLADEKPPDQEPGGLTS